MANYRIFSMILALLIILNVQDHAKSAFVTDLDPRSLGLKKEKLSHFHFFMHDIRKEGSATSVTIVSPPANQSTPGGGPTNPTDGTFGTLNVIDEPLTEMPELNSTLVGRAEGIYAQGSQEETSLVMVTNVVFLQGKYNGSSITVVGRNHVYDNIREMPVVGGSGIFRFARGYVRVSTYSVDSEQRHVTLEFNAYVTHYY